MTEHKDKPINNCNVKGCNREAKFLIIDHDFGDKEICKECVDKYFNRRYDYEEI